MMVIENDFNIGQIVYLKTDPEALPRFVSGIRIYANDLAYELSQGTNTSSHYGFEISVEKHTEIIA